MLDGREIITISRLAPLRLEISQYNLSLSRRLLSSPIRLSIGNTQTRTPFCSFNFNTHTHTRTLMHEYTLAPGWHGMMMINRVPDAWTHAEHKYQQITFTKRTNYQKKTQHSCGLCFLWSCFVFVLRISLTLFHSHSHSHKWTQNGTTTTPTKNAPNPKHAHTTITLTASWLTLCVCVRVCLSVCDVRMRFTPEPEPRHNSMDTLTHTQTHTYTTHTHI